MAKRRMAQVVTETGRFYHIWVEPTQYRQVLVGSDFSHVPDGVRTKLFRQPATDLGNLQCMRQSGVKELNLVRGQYLRHASETTEGVCVEDAVAIPLSRGPVVEIRPMPTTVTVESH
jgi:hypothetical protein